MFILYVIILVDEKQTYLKGQDDGNTKSRNINIRSEHSTV